jgi:spore maturation protein SpmB
MAETTRKTGERVREAVIDGARAGLGTVWFLLSIIVPVTLAVALLDWSGLLRAFAALIAPAMHLIGLPGEASLVFISSVLLNIYSAIAVAGSLELSLRDATILALMCLTAHNLIVETAVMRKAGSSGIKMAVLRLGMAIASAVLLNLLLPAELAARRFSSGAAAAQREFLPMLGAWGLTTLALALKIAVIVFVLMIGQKLLAEFKVLDRLSKVFSPFMAFLGLPAGSSFLWIVINVVGYAYGAGIVVKEIEEGRMKPQDGDLLNHHAAMSHSLIEDTALYMAVGIPILWITLPRLAFAMVVVWLERARRHFLRRSFRAGVT